MDSTLFSMLTQISNVEWTLTQDLYWIWWFKTNVVCRQRGPFRHTNCPVSGIRLPFENYLSIRKKRAKKGKDLVTASPPQRSSNWLSCFQLASSVSTYAEFGLYTHKQGISRQLNHQYSSTNSIFFVKQVFSRTKIHTMQGIGVVLISKNQK